MLSASFCNHITSFAQSQDMAVGFTSAFGFIILHYKLYSVLSGRCHFRLMCRMWSIEG